MVTAEEARRLRVNKGSINHETYKQIYGKLANRIRVAAARGDTWIEYRIPPLIPGRPMYDMSHAVRYNRDKLRLAGFRVTERGDDVLYVDWKPTESKRPESKRPESKQPESKRPESKRPESKRPESKQPESKRPESSVLSSSFGTSRGISQKLQDLKKKLNF